MRFPLLLLAGLLVAVLPLRAQSTSPLPTLALVELRAQNADSGDAAVIREALEVELQKTGRVRLLERSRMERILQEQGFQQSGACDGSECAVEIGRLLGLQHIAFGTLGRVGSTWSVTLKRISVQTGEIETSARDTRSGAIDELLRASIPKLAAELVSDWSGQGRPGSTAEEDRALVEVSALLSRRAWQTDSGHARLRELAPSLSVFARNRLIDDHEISSLWALGNVPVLPLGTLVQKDWEGLGWIAAGWAGAAVLALATRETVRDTTWSGGLAVKVTRTRQNSGLGGLALLAAYAYGVWRPYLFARSSNDRLTKALLADRFSWSRPEFVPLASTSGSLDGAALRWRF